MAVTFPCPECDRDLSFPESFLGKKLRCKKCRHEFWAEEPEPVEDADETEDRPAPRRKAKARPTKSPVPLVAGLAAGLVILAAVGLAAAYFAGAFQRNKATDPTSDEYVDEGAAIANRERGGVDPAAAVRGGPPPAPTERIELTDARIETVLGEIKGKLVFFMRYTVKYKFVVGAPRPGTWYVFHGQSDGTGIALLKQVDGRDLAPAGEVTNDILLTKFVIGLTVDQVRATGAREIDFDNSKLPSSGKIQVFPGRQKGSFSMTPISNVAEVEVTKRAAYPLP